MSEIIFLVEEAPEGGFTTRAAGESIFTQADSIDELVAAGAHTITVRGKPRITPSPEDMRISVSL